MRILVVVRHVPDSSATLRVSANGSAVERTGFKWVMNPFDEYAVEWAVQLREKFGGVEEIAVLGAGDSGGVEVLRTALAMGADRGIAITGESILSPDALVQTRLFASAIQREPKEFDLILSGKTSIDWDSTDLGPALAEVFQRPHVSAVNSMESFDGRRFTLHRNIEGGEEIVRCALPCVITCDKGLVIPRYPTLPNLVKARKKPLDMIHSEELSTSEQMTQRIAPERLVSPPPRPPCQFLEGTPQDMAREVARILHDLNPSRID